MSRPILIVFGLCAISSIALGCEVRPKPLLLTVEYRSGVACAPSQQECPWASLEAQASFSALVNCLLAGATVLQTQEARQAGGSQMEIVTPLPPRYGYEHVPSAGDGSVCPSENKVCRVASLHAREITWATCGTMRVNEMPRRGGEDLAHADRLTDSVVVTGSLAEATDEFRPPQGLDGPDHFYTFSLMERTRVEIAVAANTTYWSTVAGPFRSAWQPALYLLSADGGRSQAGYVLRAGVTALFPAELEPGTYYLLVDSSVRESSRGNGLYRLYVGFNQDLMGPLPR